MGQQKLKPYRLVSDENDQLDHELLPHIPSDNYRTSSSLEESYGELKRIRKSLEKEEGRKSDLHLDLDKIRRSIGQKRSELKILNEKSNAQNIEFLKIKRLINDERTQLQEINEKKNLLKEELERISFDKNDKETKLGQLNLRIQKSEEDYKINLNKLNIIEEQKKQAISEAQALNRDLDVQKKMFTNDFETLKSSFDFKIEKLDTEYKELTYKISESKKYLDGLIGKANVYESEIKTLLKNQEGLENSNNLILETQNEKRRNVQKLEDQIEKSQGQLLLLNSEIDDLLSKKTALGQTLKNLEFEEEKQRKRLAEEEKKIAMELELQKLRHDYEIESRMENLERTLKENEKNWYSEFERRKSALESDYQGQKNYLEKKHIEKISELERKQNDIVDKANKEAQRIIINSQQLALEKEAKIQEMYVRAGEIKLEAQTEVAQKIEEANRIFDERRGESNALLARAQEEYRKKCKEAETIINSAKTRGNAILQKSEIQKNEILKEAINDRHAHEKRLRDIEQSFENEFNEQKYKLKNYIAYRKEKARIARAKSIDNEKARIEKTQKHALMNVEKMKRNEFKRIAKKRNEILYKATEDLISQKNKLREMKKTELESFYSERSNLMREAEEYKRQKEKEVHEWQQEQRDLIEQLKRNQIEELNIKKMDFEKEFENKIGREKKEFENLKSKKIEHVHNCVYNYIINELQGELKEIDIEKKKEIKAGIHDVLKSSLSNDPKKMARSAGLEVDTNQQKSIGKIFVKYSSRVLPVALLGLVAFFDLAGIRTTTKNTIMTFLENRRAEAQVVQDKKVQDLQEVRIYKPDQTPGYKVTYTDNVIFTPKFHSTYESDTFQNEWILSVHEFMLSELELSEEFAINFVSSEGTLIKELSKMRSELDPRFLERGVEKMRLREQEFINWANQGFVNQENSDKFNAFKMKFYEDFVVSKGSSIE
ncbi:hypothetical protein M899_3052 [Bacteriovorax sp. BSW11_IV]|uniref:hypothetical protein n=1 Tax=Bacteriovorax sp. BSW11_IV TaxID=1353529 RepID=UPI00038A085B|nr:hypothetical protein [Bacteriovorax sp. BSW11_IV]EQC49588.1 hypothetical protein M899_3052 [Bacteriovorax sp. BSW11_IV]